MPYIESQGKKLLFIHIPKTGGTSIEKAMSKVGNLCFSSHAIPMALKVPPEHFTWSDCAALFPQGYFDYSFTVIRNPYDRIESEYRMRAILNSQGLWGASPRFSIWLANSIQQSGRDRQMLANHFRPQADFLGSGVHVFRYEDGLEKIVNHVGQQTGMSLVLPEERHLSGAKFGKTIHWEAQDIHLVNEFYRSDFERLGYEMRNPGFSINSIGGK